ncbi:MAG: phospholipid carrier-dependent glycosyltransferase, partial [SAR202 cluster bacterium]|nr:phospholipid carrier-dependent glycosyltransferase [SAR202 cluster bacterium]
MPHAGILQFAKARWIPLTLAVILLAALGLRLYGMNWDQGYGFHPDERSIYMQSDCMYRILTEASGHRDCPTFIDYPETQPGLPSFGEFFDAERSALNPHWFPLGSVHLYAMVLIRSIIEPFGDFTGTDMRYAGRTLSALADVASILMLFLLGRRLFNARVGLLAAGLMAAAVIHIQHSHFYRPETFIVLALLAAYWQMLNVIEKRRLRDWLLLGLLVGLMFSIKVSVLPLFLPLLLTYGFRLFTRRDGSGRVPSADSLYRTMGHAVAGGVVAAVVFVALTPYAIIDAGEFIADTTWEADIAREAGKMPYTIQYIGTTPFIYELRHSLPWALGLPLAAAVVMGVGYSIYRTLRRREGWRGDLLLLAWILPNFLLVGGLFEVKFQRYIFPIMPFLILLGSRWMLDMVAGAKVASGRAKERIRDAGLRSRINRMAPVGAWALLGVVVAGTLVYAIAFMGVYQRAHPAVAASRWINANVPIGTTIITDNHWDEGIPDIYRYDVRQIPIYEGDNSAKITRVASDLSRGEYLVFYSNRPYGSVSRVPERYPLSGNYYHRLFNGELGYKPERAFTSYPEFLGVAFKNDTFERAGLPEPEAFRDSSNAPVTLNLGYADENVANYDHPAVLMFRNVEHKSRDQLLTLLLTPEGAREPGLMLNAGDLRAQREGGTWSGVVSEGSWTNQAPVLAWLLLVELIYIVTLPLAFFIFRPLADRGIVLARILGILLVSYVAWLLASVHWVSFSRASMVAGLLAVGALSAVAAWRLRREMLAFLRS